MSRISSLYLICILLSPIYANHTYNSQVGAGYSKNADQISNIYYSNEVRWFEGKNEISFKSINNFTLTDGNVTKNNSFLHLGYDYSQTPTWTFFVFNNLNLSPVESLNLRNDAGIGEKIEVLKQSIFTLDIGVAPVISYSRYTDSRSTLFGGSFRTRFVVDFTPTWSLHTTYYYVFDTQNQALHTLNNKLIHFFNPTLGTSMDGAYMYENTQNTSNYNVNWTLIFKI